MGKFVVKQTKNGFVFNLKAGNGEIIATSQTYSGEDACMNGIESVRKNAELAKLEDQTVENFETVTNPKFEVYLDKRGEYRFRLKARNGEPIAASGKALSELSAKTLSTSRDKVNFYRRKQKWLVLQVSIYRERSVSRLV